MRTYFLVLLFSEHGNNVALEIQGLGVVFTLLSQYSHYTIFTQEYKIMSSWSKKVREM